MTHTHTHTQEATIFRHRTRSARSRSRACLPPSTHTQGKNDALCGVTLLGKAGRRYSSLLYKETPTNQGCATWTRVEEGASPPYKEQPTHCGVTLLGKAYTVEEDASLG